MIPQLWQPKTPAELREMPKLERYNFAAMVHHEANLRGIRPDARPGVYDNFIEVQRRIIIARAEEGVDASCQQLFDDLP